MVELAPMVAPRRTTVLPNCSRASLNSARGLSTFVNTALGPTKTSSSMRTPVPDQDCVLDGDAVADHGAGLDEGMIADVAADADLRPFHHVGECPNARALADLVALTESALMDEEIAHLQLPAPVAQHWPRLNVVGHPCMLW